MIRGIFFSFCFLLSEANIDKGWENKLKKIKVWKGWFYLLGRYIAVVIGEKNSSEVNETETQRFIWNYGVKEIISQRNSARYQLR